MIATVPYGVTMVTELNPANTYEVGPGFGLVFPVTVVDDQILKIVGYQQGVGQDFVLDFTVSDQPWSAPLEATYPLREDHYAMRRVSTSYLLCDPDVAPPLPNPPAPPLGVGPKSNLKKPQTQTGTDPNTVIWRLLPGQYYVNIQNLENRKNSFYLEFIPNWTGDDNTNPGNGSENIFNPC